MYIFIYIHELSLRCPRELIYACICVHTLKYKCLFIYIHKRVCIQIKYGYVLHSLSHTHLHTRAHTHTHSGLRAGDRVYVTLLHEYVVYIYIFSIPLSQTRYRSVATECTCLWVWAAERRNSTGALLSNDSWVLPTVGNRYQLVYSNGSTVCDEVLQGAAAGVCVCVCVCV
jgi:hypothetical protein